MFLQDLNHSWQIQQGIFETGPHFVLQKSATGSVSEVRERKEEGQPLQRLPLT